MDKFCLSVKHEIREYYGEIRNILNSIDEYLMELPKKDSPSPKEVDYFKQMCSFLLRKFHRSQFPMIKIRRTLDTLNGYAKTIHYENHRLYTDYFRLLQSYRQLLDDIEMFEDDNDEQIIDRDQYRYAQYDEKLDMYDEYDLSDKNNEIYLED